MVVLWWCVCTYVYVCALPCTGSVVRVFLSSSLWRRPGVWVCMWCVCVYIISCPLLVKRLCHNRVCTAQQLLNNYCPTYTGGPANIYRRYTTLGAAVVFLVLPQPLAAWHAVPCAVQQALGGLGVPCVSSWPAGHGALCQRHDACRTVISYPSACSAPQQPSLWASSRQGQVSWCPPASSVLPAIMDGVQRAT